MARLRPRRSDAGDPGEAGAIPARVHLVGAGGIHMSAIGELLLGRGHELSGSDVADTPLTRRLRALGATIDVGHAAEQLGDAELVVTTAAAGDANPELQAARERGLPVLLRSSRRKHIPLRTINPGSTSLSRPKRAKPPGNWRPSAFLTISSSPKTPRRRSSLPTPVQGCDCRKQSARPRAEGTATLPDKEARESPATPP